MWTSFVSSESLMYRAGWDRRDSDGLCLEVRNELGGMKLGDTRIRGWYMSCVSCSKLGIWRGRSCGIDILGMVWYPMACRIGREDPG